MLSLICPECGAENPLTAERCSECEASLADVFPNEMPGEGLPLSADLDLLNRSGDDLPDLLHALKQEDPEGAPPGGMGKEQENIPGPTQDLADVGDDDEEPETPEWLHRIRQRASQEHDSVGEITQKISSALESLATGKHEDQHENFEVWVQSLNEAGQQKTTAQASGDVDAQADENSDWLTRIRKAEGKFPVSDDEETEKPGDEEDESLLKWLVGRDDVTEEPAEETSEDTPEETLEETDEAGEDLQQLGEDTRETPTVDEEPAEPLVASPAKDPEPIRTKPPVLTITREEKARADQLAAIIVDEQAARPVRAVRKAPANRIMCLLMSLFLIAGVSLSLFWGQKAGIVVGNLQPHNTAILTWARDFPEDSALLIIFDYHAGYAGEVSLVAKPILELAIKEGSTVSILSSTVAGGLLGGQLLDEILSGEGNPIMDLGYFPGSAYGAFALQDQTRASWKIRGFPDSAKTLPEADYEGVLILSDNFEGARIWIEQLTMRIPDTPINLLVTAQAGALLLPYYQSGQVTGMISGLSEAASVEMALSTGDAVAVRWQAYQIGTIILIVLMVVGIIYGGGTDPDSPRRGVR